MNRYDEGAPRHLYKVLWGPEDVDAAYIWLWWGRRAAVHVIQQIIVQLQGRGRPAERM
jgi:hypothetical protein